MNTTWVILRLPNDTPQQVEDGRPRAGRNTGQGVAAIDRKDYIQSRYLTEKAANTAAQELARKEPTVPFAVMGIVRVFETTEPKVIEKIFNTAGELVLTDKGKVPGSPVMPIELEPF